MVKLKDSVAFQNWQVTTKKDIKTHSKHDIIEKNCSKYTEA